MTLYIHDVIKMFFPSIEVELLYYYSKSENLDRIKIILEEYVEEYEVKTNLRLNEILITHENKKKLIKLVKEVRWYFWKNGFEQRTKVRYG